MTQKTRKADKKKRVLEALFNNHGHISKACEAANVGRKTFYRWKEQDQDFAQEVALVEEDLVDHVKSKLMENINNNDTTSIIFFLKTKGKDHGFTERKEVSLSKPISDINFNEI